MKESDFVDLGHKAMRYNHREYFMSSSKSIGLFRLYEERECQVTLFLVVDNLR